MSTTPQTVTLAGEDYVVIRRAEHERRRGRGRAALTPWRTR